MLYGKFYVSFICICLFGVLRPTREFFTDFEMSPLPVNGYKFLPMLGTHGHWSVRVLQRTTPSVTRANPLWWSSQRTRDTHTCCRAFGIVAFTTCVNDLVISWPGIEPRSPACEANTLPESHRGDYVSFKLTENTVTIGLETKRKYMNIYNFYLNLWHDFKENLASPCFGKMLLF